MVMHQDALFEIQNVQQIVGEPKRRWFFSHEMDLIVWLDEQDRPTAFQLSYDKYRNERALRWRPEQGYSHYQVDDERLGARPGSALLIPDGRFDAPRVRRQFLILSSAIPASIANFVSHRLDDYPAYGSQSTKIGVAVTLTLAAVVLLILFHVGSSRDWRHD